MFVLFEVNESVYSVYSKFPVDSVYSEFNLYSVDSVESEYCGFVACGSL